MKSGIRICTVRFGLVLAGPAVADRHFAASDGCPHLGALQKGEVAFIPTLPP